MQKFFKISIVLSQTGLNARHLAIVGFKLIFRSLMTLFVTRYRTLKKPEAKGNKCSHENVGPMLREAAVKKHTESVIHFSPA